MKKVILVMVIMLLACACSGDTSTYDIVDVEPVETKTEPSAEPIEKPAVLDLEVEFISATVINADEGHKRVYYKFSKGGSTTLDGIYIMITNTKSINHGFIFDQKVHGEKTFEIELDEHTPDVNGHLAMDGSIIDRSSALISGAFEPIVDGEQIAELRASYTLKDS